MDWLLWMYWRRQRTQRQPGVHISEKRHGLLVPHFFFSYSYSYSPSHQIAHAPNTRRRTPMHLNSAWGLKYLSQGLGSDCRWQSNKYSDRVSAKYVFPMHVLKIPQCRQIVALVNRYDTWWLPLLSGITVLNALHNLQLIYGRGISQHWYQSDVTIVLWICKNHTN